jgi:uncharacterized protein (TIGR03000 family)
MCRTLRAALPLAALAGLLLLPQLALAQVQSFPGDWPEPGRGPGFGRSGFQAVSGALPFPYNGINNQYGGRVLLQPSTIFVPSPAMDASRAYIRVRVPAGAQVMFDGSRTRQTGTDRLFQSPPLQVGAAYTYQVSARWQVNGYERNEVRTVRVVPGQVVDVDFAR